MSLRCPQCGALRVATHDHARRTGGTVGTVAGASLGVASLAGGAEAGAALGAVAGPVGIVAGGLAGAIITVLLSSTAGCLVGAKCGGAIDRQVLDNHRCLACGYRFGQR